MENEKILADVPAPSKVKPLEKQAAPRTKSGLRSVREAVERIVNGIFFLCGFVAVACVLFISIYLIISGLPPILKIGAIDFLFGDTWAPKQEIYGILPFILTSVAGTGGAVLIGVPVGVLIASTTMADSRLAPEDR